MGHGGPDEQWTRRANPCFGKKNMGLPCLPTEKGLLGEVVQFTAPTARHIAKVLGTQARDHQRIS